MYFYILFQALFYSNINGVLQIVFLLQGLDSKRSNTLALHILL